MASPNWPGHITDYSDLESGSRQQTLEVKRNHVDHRPSTIDVAIPISTEVRPSKPWRSWWRRYWVFVLAMAILVVGGIIAGAVGGISAAAKADNGES
ncbi:hypothetical protein CMUS01_03145 [Colletotrichum musicola]|uniref:Uncharacterized protein n=1 Tax=Colletotrichum musicola TaxID=2175873 RepID=A0A8H6U6S0_9PEZI|nr:hypothetical protein CMUS01_03145 [Colletotrichum musicola]